MCKLAYIGVFDFWKGQGDAPFVEIAAKCVAGREALSKESESGRTLSEKAADMTKHFVE